jgi:hypothetical protein
MPKFGIQCWLYLYEGCEKHGVKVGCTVENGLPGRLQYARRTCRARDDFAEKWHLPGSAYAIEQMVIDAMWPKQVGQKRSEWFLASIQEVRAAVERAIEFRQRNPGYPSPWRRAPTKWKAPPPMDFTKAWERMCKELGGPPSPPAPLWKPEST